MPIQQFNYYYINAECVKEHGINVLFSKSNKSEINNILIKSQLMRLQFYKKNSNLWH